MKAEYDMTDAMRATDVEHLNRLRREKQRITIMLDEDILQAFRDEAATRGVGYQTLINLALREHLESRPIDEETLRRVIREELKGAA